MRGLDDGMRGMNLQSGGHRGRGGSVAQGQYHGAGDQRSEGRGGPPPQARAPPQGWDAGRGGRLPPASRGGFSPNARGGYGPSRGPPAKQNIIRDDRPQLDYQDQYYNYGNSPEHQQEPSLGISRAQTMPASIQQQQQQPQYKAYNPAQYKAPAAATAGQAAAHGNEQAPQPRNPRESIGDILDAYGDAGEYYNQNQGDGYGNHGGYGNGNHYEYYNNQQPNHSEPPVPRNNYPRPQGAGTPAPGQQYPPPASDYGYDNQSQYAGSQHAGSVYAGSQYAGSQIGVYDGPAEMAGDVPPMPMNGAYPPRTQASLPPQMSSNMGPIPGHNPGILPPHLQQTHPMAARVASPDPRSLPQVVPTPPGSLPPTRRPSVQSNAGLIPVYSNTSTSSNPDSPLRSNPDGLPAHPPPVRPGLVPEAGARPVPVRQYSQDRPDSQNLAPITDGPVTTQELARLQNEARINPSDQKLQLLLAKKMVEAASVLASEGGRADVKTTRKNRENYIFDAHKIVKRLTSGSHPYPDALFYLAQCYGEGALGLQPDHERAFNLYQSAAKSNHGPSCYRVAVCSELGAGIRKDPNRAMTWYKKAASLGETPAMFKLGMILLKGLLGQPRNPREGLTWLKRAADKADTENQHALHELGLLYSGAAGGAGGTSGSDRDRDVIIPDIDYARSLFLQAADLGYPASQFKMGCAYEYGLLGCGIDPRKSIAWYSKAAVKGNHEAQLALSGWYLTGAEGILQQSDTEAYLWARKAAERGLAKAEFALGYYTEVGIGVRGDLEEAKRWYYKAASQQHPKAQARLQELKQGGAKVQKSRERLSRSNVNRGGKDEGDCVVM
ncbi:hypothetical protein BZA77DRAFT_335580 [Pyronema omphalodes]|nr:hypothetical protein BZA77DRAFT_335580 [Pyronema omphalodes]